MGKKMPTEERNYSNHSAKIAYAANIVELNLKFEITGRLNGLAPSIGLLPVPCVFHVSEAGSSCFESHR